MRALRNKNKQLLAACCNTLSGLLILIASQVFYQQPAHSADTDLSVSAFALINTEKTHTTYQVRRGDSLLKIAKGLNTPDAHYYQVAVALWLKNPAAFIKNNPSNIAVNKRLQIPTRSEIHAYSSAEAGRLINSGKPPTIRKPLPQTAQSERDNNSYYVAPSEKEPSKTHENNLPLSMEAYGLHNEEHEKTLLSNKAVSDFNSQMRDKNSFPIVELDTLIRQAEALEQEIPTAERIISRDFTPPQEENHGEKYPYQWQPLCDIPQVNYQAQSAWPPALLKQATQQLTTANKKLKVIEQKITKLKQDRDNQRQSLQLASEDIEQQIDEAQNSESERQSAIEQKQEEVTRLKELASSQQHQTNAAVMQAQHQANTTVIWAQDQTNTTTMQAQDQTNTTAMLAQTIPVVEKRSIEQLTLEEAIKSTFDAAAVEEVSFQAWELPTTTLITMKKFHTETVQTPLSVLTATQEFQPQAFNFPSPKISNLRTAKAGEHPDSEQSIIEKYAITEETERRLIDAGIIGAKGKKAGAPSLLLAHTARDENEPANKVTVNHSKAENHVKHNTRKMSSKTQASDTSLVKTTTTKTKNIKTLRPKASKLVTTEDKKLSPQAMKTPGLHNNEPVKAATHRNAKITALRNSLSQIEKVNFKAQSTNTPKKVRPQDWMTPASKIAFDTKQPATQARTKTPNKNKSKKAVAKKKKLGVTVTGIYTIPASGDKPFGKLSASWTPKTNWFMRGAAKYTGDEGFTYSWGMGYSDWRPGTTSVQLNNWGPVKSGEGLDIDDAVFSISHKVDSKLLSDNKLSMSLGLSIPINGDAAFNATFQWNPIKNWYFRTTASQKLKGGPTKWSYGFGHFDWRPGTWRVEYSNYEENRYPFDNFRKGAVTINRAWEF